MPLAEILKALPSLTEAERQSLIFTSLDLNSPPSKAKSPVKRESPGCPGPDNNSGLSEELIEAGLSLEERFSILEVHSRKVPPEEWDTLPSGLRKLIQPWIVLLLSRFSIVGGTLEGENFDDSMEGAEKQILFSFYAPVYFRSRNESAIDNKSDWPLLVEHGFFPFASSDGENQWLTSVKEGPADKIYYLNRSAYHGGKPSLENGLLYAQINLESLLMCLAVSNESFNGNNDLCMWGGKNR